MLYARRKRWAIGRVAVQLRHDKVDASAAPGAGRREGTIDRIELELLLGGDLTTEQEQRLRQIARRCPVHRALAGEAVISETRGA